jgi:hypothetical protein
MKGFVITLISIVLIATLVTFSITLHNAHLKMERALKAPQPLMYAGSMFDDVAVDINEIVGPELSIYERNDSLGIAISDSLPKENYSEDLLEYEAHLEGRIANETNSFIDVNLSSIASGVKIAETYDYQNDDDIYFSAPGGTGATSYEINVTVHEHPVNISSFAFNPWGDLEIILRYDDMNGTRVESGRVFSHVLNRFEVGYGAGRNVEIEVGRISGRNGALGVDAVDTAADVSFLAWLPEADEEDMIGYAYDATMYYEQGNIIMERRIGK